MNDLDFFINNRIKQYGYSYIATEIDETSMTYTVGLSDSDLPEIVVFGLPLELAVVMLSEAVKLLLPEG